MSKGVLFKAGALLAGSECPGSSRTLVSPPALSARLEICASTCFVPVVSSVPKVLSSQPLLVILRSYLGCMVPAFSSGFLLLPHSNYLPSLARLTVNWKKTLSHWLPSHLRDKKLKLQGIAAGPPPCSGVDTLGVVSLMLSLHDQPTCWPH